jgi:hypothetical protein
MMILRGTVRETGEPPLVERAIQGRDHRVGMRTRGSGARARGLGLGVGGGEQERTACRGPVLAGACLL